MKLAVSICVNLTQFGAATVFVLLCAKNTQEWLASMFDVHISICALLLAVVALIWPATMLKSPNDFWQLLFAGMFCTLAAFLLICFGALNDFFSNNSNANNDGGEHLVKKDDATGNLENYLSALGTMLFAYGGHPAIPTIQHDMAKPSEFHKSVIAGFTIITAFNVIVVCCCGIAYGNNNIAQLYNDSASSSASTIASFIRVDWIRHCVVLFTTGNSLLSIVLILNPLNQEMEEIAHVPQEFCWQRVAVRSAVLIAILFITQTTPSFGPVLDFFAGATIALTSIIFPWLFHLILTTRSHEENEKGVEQATQETSAVSEPKQRETIAAKCSNSSATVWLTKWITMVMENTNNNTTTSSSAAVAALCRCVLYGIVIVFAALIGICVTFTALNELTGAQYVQPCYLRRWF